MVIGMTGLNSSGKDIAAEYLVGQGFAHVSLADILREEAGRRGIEPTRANLSDLGTKIKHEEGLSVLADRAIERVRGDTVITAIRHPQELEILKTLPGFRLIFIDAPAAIRYQRAKTRARPGDNIQSFETFLRLEKKERAPGVGQSVDEVVKLADYTVDNRHDLPQLYRQLDELLKKLRVDSKDRP